MGVRKKKARKKSSKPRINSRAKGVRAEQQARVLFEEWWGSKMFRTPSSGAFSTRTKVVEMSGDIGSKDPLFPFCVECKHHEEWVVEQLLTIKSCPIHDWWKQTLYQTPSHKIPLLVFRRSRHPWFFLMHSKVLMSKDVSMDWDKTFMYKDVVIGLLSDLLETPPEAWGKQVEIEE